MATPIAERSVVVELTSVTLAEALPRTLKLAALPPTYRCAAEAVALPLEGVGKIATHESPIGGSANESTAFRGSPSIVLNDSGTRTTVVDVTNDSVAELRKPSGVTGSEVEIEKFSAPIILVTSNGSVNAPEAPNDSKPTHEAESPARGHVEPATRRSRLTQEVPKATSRAEIEDAICSKPAADAMIGVETIVPVKARLSLEELEAPSVVRTTANGAAIVSLAVWVVLRAVIVTADVA